MRLLLARLFRLMFGWSFFRKRFFGIYRRVIHRYRLVNSIVIRVTVRNGVVFELHLGDWIQDQLFFLGSYEEPELRFLERTLKHGDVFIDIGANIGWYTLAAAKLVGNAGRVIAFEPFAENFKRLQRNASLNNFANVTLESLAVADSSTSLVIRYDASEHNTGMASAYANAPLHETVNATSLDDYLLRHRLTRVDFIKLDIEGGEFPALLGMRETLKRFGPTVLVEISDDILAQTPYTKNDMVTYLQSLGYNMFCINDNGELKECSDRNARENFVFIRRRVD